MHQHFDLTGQAFKRDPAPTFAHMRRLGPVLESRMPILGRIRYVTTYDAVTALLKDHERFTVDATLAGHKRAMGTQWWMPKAIRLLADNMLTNDAEEHRRLRKCVDGTFRKQPIDAYRPAILRAADALLDDLAASGDGDLVRHFARALPLAVISDLLGLPQADRPKFIKWMAAMSSVTSAFGVFRILPAVKALSAYLKEQFRLRKRDPDDSLISALVNPLDGEAPLSDDQLLSMCFLLFVAGHETTTHLISGGVLALLENRTELLRLQQDWSLAPAAVEECLRFVSPVQMTKPRFAVADLEFRGTPVRRGDMLVALLASANLDPDGFERPDRFLIDRSPNRHVAFGNGPHLCLGLHLARAEMQIALERLFQRYPDAGLAIGGDQLRWTGRIGIRALSALPLRLTP